MLDGGGVGVYDLVRTRQLPFGEPMSETTCESCVRLRALLQGSMEEAERANDALTAYLRADEQRNRNAPPRIQEVADKEARRLALVAMGVAEDGEDDDIGM